MTSNEKWQRKRNFEYRTLKGKNIETIICYDKIDLKDWFFSRQKQMVCFFLGHKFQQIVKHGKNWDYCCIRCGAGIEQMNKKGFSFGYGGAHIPLSRGKSAIKHKLQCLHNSHWQKQFWI